MAEFLLELFSEEIPARMQVKAAEDLKDLVTKALTEKGLTFTKAEAHSTPRRITLVVDGLPEQQPDTVVEKRGPRVDAPEQAIQGFLKSVNLTSLDTCVKEESPKGTFWFYRENKKGERTSTVLGEITFLSIMNFSWPKSMRWSWYNDFSWVRPLKSVIALFNGEPLNNGFQLASRFDIKYTNKTQGHRFLSSPACHPREGGDPVRAADAAQINQAASFPVSNFADYKEKLKKAHVLLDREDRKAIILQQSQTLANQEKLNIKEDPALLEEIVGLVEWPVPLVGTFEKEYLDVPQEVLISTMRGNQKYLALVDNNGKLANKFILVANTITEDGGKCVVAGNEKVLRARLSDAKFFWDQDRKQKLETRNAALEQITFHKKLGTVKDKVARLKTLSKTIADVLGFKDAHLAERAAELCKADLTCGVVYQFPEVQGIMGRYYALHDKEAAEVANAISDHYKPIGAGDTCPTAPISICVALADKIDTLVGFFAIDEKPTGSKDPFALRRAALGIIRIALENNLDFSLTPLFAKAYELYASKVKGLKAEADVQKDLLQFFIDRQKVALKDQGLKLDRIETIFAAPVVLDNIYENYNLVVELQNFMNTENGKNLIVAYKRGANLLQAEEKKDGNKYIDSISKFSHDLEGNDTESVLYNAARDVGVSMQKCREQKKFKELFEVMSTLRTPVDAFFDGNMVNDPNPTVRERRLSILAMLRKTMNLVGDFSKIVD